jgi:hypothetical protein
VLVPPSVIANCYLGYVLNSLAREDEARERFATCLELEDEFPDRDRVEAWLAYAEPRRAQR